ncbi:MAG: hypothetical protein JW839_01160 [Candidatus Lokiarchaeota archaeon]|nr:hypothetical protein [Candidatus Lokiarchaeota archaeon]
MLKIYRRCHLDKGDERLGLFEQVKAHHTITNVLYPGSYAHLTPAFIFPVVYFNDTYQKLEKFYESDEIHDYVLKKKQYPGQPFYKYIKGVFTRPLPLPEKFFDLVISQYAGFISRYCKVYLKIGGVLIANNSHGDASMASIDPDYEFIAVINKHGESYSYSTSQLESYFIPKKNIEITRELIEKLRRGVGYNRSASNYVFRLI